MAKGQKKTTKPTIKKPAVKPLIVHKYSVRATAGRPPHYDTPEELQEAVDNYFIYCEGEFHIETKVVANSQKRGNKIPEDEKENQDVKTEEIKIWDRYPEPYTVTGLVLFLGFAHRQSLDDYEERPAFSDIIKRGRSRVENAYEKRLFHDRPAGAIFALTNMGWKNQQNFDHTTGGQRINSADLSKLSDDELAKVAELQLKVRGE